MSSDPTKIASSAHHWRCTSIQLSSTARTPARRPFQLTICCSKKPMKRLPIMFCSATSLSSSASITPSAGRRIGTPVFLNGSYSSTSPIHVASILASCLSIFSSIRACSTVSPTPSTCFSSSSASSIESENLSSITKLLPQIRISFFQWRSRIASSRRSWTRGSAWGEMWKGEGECVRAVGARAVARRGASPGRAAARRACSGATTTSRCTRPSSAPPSGSSPSPPSAAGSPRASSRRRRRLDEGGAG